jgi:hypothetical protein
MNWLESFNWCAARRGLVGAAKYLGAALIVSAVVYNISLFVLAEAASWELEYNKVLSEKMVGIREAQKYLNTTFCSPNGSGERLDTGRYDLCANARAVAQQNPSREALLEMLTHKRLCPEGTCLRSSTLWFNIFAAVAAIVLLIAVFLSVLSLIRFAMFLEAKVRESYSLPFSQPGYKTHPPSVNHAALYGNFGTKQD